MELTITSAILGLRHIPGYCIAPSGMLSSCEGHAHFVNGYVANVFVKMGEKQEKVKFIKKFFRKSCSVPVLLVLLFSL